MPPKRTTAPASDDSLSKRPRRGENDAAGENAPRWNEHDTLIWGVFGETRNCDKMAAFDFDDTLVETASGKTFAQSATDWKYFHEKVAPTLKDYHNQGYQLVIFTNQKGISSERKGGSKGGAKERAILGRLVNFIESVALPFKVFAATDDDIYRKPSKGMFEYFVKHLNNGIAIDLKNSLYVGDAAGRADGWKAGRKKDFSCSDREYALNLNLPFKTPEEFFLHEAPAPFKHSFDPRTIKMDLPLVQPENPPIVSTKQEIIIMVGPPGSGKSFFSKTHLVPAGYERCNMDEMKTKQKVISSATKALDEGKKVVIDNTNGDRATRATFIDMAKTRGIPVRIFKLTTSFEMAKHMNYFRMKLTGERRIPDIAYNVFKKNYVEPQLSEGVTEIKLVNFRPNFANERDKKLFTEFTPS